MDFADTGVMVDEDLRLGLGIGDCSAVMGHDLIGRVGIWGTVEVSNDFPQICAVSV